MNALITQEVPVIDTTAPQPVNTEGTPTTISDVQPANTQPTENTMIASDVVVQNEDGTVSVYGSDATVGVPPKQEQLPATGNNLQIAGSGAGLVLAGLAMLSVARRPKAKTHHQ